HGALVNRLIEGSPAQEAGIQLGDVIVSIDNHSIRKGADLPYYVGLVVPNSTVPVEIVRNGQPRTLSLTIGLREDDVVAAINAPEEAEVNRLGLRVVPAEAELLVGLGVDEAVVVESVEGPAQAARLRQGDVIITLNNESIGSQEELDELAAELPTNRALPVLVARGQAQTFFTI